MRSAVQQSLVYAIVTAQLQFDQSLVLNVSRENIVGDTVAALSIVKERDLKKPLKIEFRGEEAEDVGGVRKEFFLLLIKEILDPKYGMFKMYKETNTLWFSRHLFEDGENMFSLIGIMVYLLI